MAIPLWAWFALVLIVAVLIAVDLLVFGRGAHEVSIRDALVWSIVWTVLGVAFAGVLLVWHDSAQAGEYLSGYLIERTLSMDNLFVFAVIFGYFAVPYALQPTILMYGIIGALVLRLVFILVGAALLDAFSWIIYVFGVFLIYTGYRLAKAHGDTSVDPERNPVLKLIRRRIPLTDDYEGTRVFVQREGRRYATPILAVLAVVATTDVIFAIDSIPAIFAVTEEPFIVFAANAFALMGLRALYFLLAGAIRRFEYLSYGLAILLGLVGLKMLLSSVWHPPTWVTLVMITSILAASIGYSMWATRPGRPREQTPTAG
jgi:tellurite resistance protein TerC